MKSWFNNLNTVNTIIVCFAANIVGLATVYLRLKGMIPIGAFVGIGIFFETIILLYKKYFSDNAEINDGPKISDEVAQAMADKIIKEAEEHRRNRQEEDNK
tara:strand:- start:8731 stop:9033 length:303 start_codon:yes stop_codon:yes gene_type:complete